MLLNVIASMDHHDQSSYLHIMKKILTWFFGQGFKYIMNHQLSYVTHMMYIEDYLSCTVIQNLLFYWTSMSVIKYNRNNQMYKPCLDYSPIIWGYESTLGPLKKENNHEILWLFHEIS